MGMPIDPVWAQSDFRGYQDGTESGATAIAAAGTNFNYSADTIFLVRFLVQQTEATATQNLSPTLKAQYNLNSGGYTDVSGSSPIQFANSTNLTDGGATTQQIGAGSFITGEINESGTVTATFTSEATSETEFLIVLQMDSAQVEFGDTILLRLVESDNTVLDSYTGGIPTIGVDEPLVAGTTTEEISFSGLTGADPNVGVVIEAGATSEEITFTGLQGSIITTYSASISGNMVFGGNISISV